VGAVMLYPQGALYCQYTARLFNLFFGGEPGCGKSARPVRAAVQGCTLSTYIAETCGRFTRNYTWEQIQALYRLTVPAAIPNLQPRFNVHSACSRASGM
jgi:hypothetical protein